ncbi:MULTISPECIES: response regulator [Trichocoleus]|uniref:Response regulatory domain-containing protein n=1 Tax=Trichocoleus desertorum GB2-A4 TaxID=2933944 RepID=A0ABV0JFE8_9CYAN|nr:response regulator [Trichocoleus sp. FACHB-46]MBD1865546.1 hypothetical protein [Trichocoleus sp. FACHB-46]
MTPGTKESSLILIVNNDLLTGLQLQLYLQKEEYRVAKASDGLAGLVDYTELQPGLIFLDALMPNKQG